MSNQNNGNYYNPGMFPQGQNPYQQQPGQQPMYPPQPPMQQLPVPPQQGYPMQPQPQMQQPNFGQGMQQPQQPPMLQQIPNYARPDEQAMIQAYQQHRESSNNGSGFNFVKFLGPNGEDKWGSVPVNYTAMLRLYILPPWTQGKNIFAISKSHFWKSPTKPQGASIGCPGQETCKTCQAKIQALDSGNAVLQKKANNFGRVRTQFMYQVAILDFLQYHVNSGMVPYILPAGSNLHSDIGNLIEDKGISIFDPMQGRPLKVKKTKTGPTQLDIEYKCSDEDPSPLPQVFWPLLNNLIDLEQVNKTPTDQEMMMAVQDMGLVLSPYGGPNPYEIQTQQAQPQMPYIPPAMPPVMPVQQQQAQPSMPNMVQPMQPQQQPMGPPPMSPPPVTSDGSGQNYAAQPSQQTQAPQQQTQQAPQDSASQQGFVRQPIQQTQQSEQPKEQQAQQPQTLEQIQAMVRGNNG